ncbi:MAG: hypothetical protein M3Q22_16215 [Actinomycetota bacterium]|nr:hypothetical protein [Actinomycetota bacterium]
MTWTKLGEEWPDAARELTDAAFRTHVEALCWSNRRGLDLHIPKRDLRRFAETDDPDTAVKNLVTANWWQDCGDTWFIGVQFADWQLESSVVNKRREDTALRVRRHRMHEAGEHSICLPKNCPYLRNISSGSVGSALGNALRDALPGTERNGAEQNGSARSGEVVWKVGETEVVVGEPTADWPPVRRPSGPLCHVCHEPIDPAVGEDTHPGCEEVA